MAPANADAVVGMMDGAYFVGRKELLDFLNDLLDLKLQKIEETAPGHIACQLVDMMFPGSIPMSKVDWSAKNDYEFIQNYKHLQNAFTKHHVQRYIDVDKLIRAKYQDNLEMMQWFKAFFDQSGATKDNYDPASVRAKGKGGAQYNKKYSSASGTMALAAPENRTSRPSVNRSTRTAPAAAPKPSSSRPGTSLNGTAESRGSGGPLRERLIEEKGTGAQSATDLELMKKNDQLTSQVKELLVEKEELIDQAESLGGKLDEQEQAIMEIEQERDFFYQKMRHVEIMLQAYQEREDSDSERLIEKLFQVLYANPDDNLVVDDAGEITETANVSQELEDVL